MADQHLHIVCLDVPYPVNYGGVFDLFFKITALHKHGIKIHLHCFEYGRGKQDELNKYCEEVVYYRRKIGLKGFSVSLPYIVNSRRDDTLLANLLKDDHPVLLEGIHCTYYLYKNALLNKKVFVRLHNVEFEYYNQLAKSETSFSKKMYFLRESRLLKRYEKAISSKATFITVALADKQIYQDIFNARNIKFLPVFLPYTYLHSKQGKGTYCLYHGNLSIAENEKAVMWLLKNIFNHVSIPLVIAGKNPSAQLRDLVYQNSNTSLVPDPKEQELNELIREAQINILPSFNATGVKIKLLNALYNGRHCITNDAAIDGTGLQVMCTIATDTNSFKKNIETLFDRPFTDDDIIMRRQLLLPIFNNEQNARQLIEWIY